MIVRSELPWSFINKAPSATYPARTAYTPVYRTANSPEHFKSHQTQHYPTGASVQSNQMKDTLLRSSSHYVYSTPFSKKDGRVFEESTKDEGAFTVSNGINFRKKYIPDPSCFKETSETSIEMSSDVKYLKGEIIRLRKELQESLLQKEQFKSQVKVYEQQKQQAVNNRNKHLMSLLDDYNNMKVIVEKLIEDNITLRAENERIKVESNMKIVKPPTANSISELRHEISMLKRQNNELETDNKYVEEYKELLKSKEIDIENLKTNQQNMEMKLKELLDGLRFYHERFEEEKAEMFDEHDNFKKSAISEIGRLKRQLLEKSRVPELDYDFESDANYIKLITY